MCTTYAFISLIDVLSSLNVEIMRFFPFLAAQNKEAIKNLFISLTIISVGI